MKSASKLMKTIKNYINKTKILNLTIIRHQKILKIEYKILYQYAIQTFKWKKIKMKVTVLMI